MRVLWACIAMTSKNENTSLLKNFDVYLCAKSQLDSSIFLQTQSDWLTTFWGIIPEQGFCQILGLRWKVKNQKNFILHCF